jgi:2-polyprenyl-6-methoxyphenol hydroxylase-like FAD-dependent oxidoreductase
MEFKRYEETTGGIVAHFADGATLEGSLLVGADGVRSPLRHQLFRDFEILDSDARCIYGKTPWTPQLESSFPEIARKKMSLIKDSRSIILFLEPFRWKEDPHITSGGRLNSADDYVYWVLAWSRKYHPIPDSELFALSTSEVFDLSIELTQAWNPSIRSLLELQAREQASALRPASISPVMPAWETNPRIVLIGDAIHPMTPAAGSGANTALKDAHGLAEVIAKDWHENGGRVKKENIAAFEEEMRGYARKAVGDSWAGAKHLFGQKDWSECTRLGFE